MGQGRGVWKGQSFHRLGGKYPSPIMTLGVWGGGVWCVCVSVSVQRGRENDWILTPVVWE